MKDCRLALFTLQDTLSLHSHHCPTCTKQLQSILYEILSGWSFVKAYCILEVFYKVKVQLGALLVAVVRC